MLSSVSMLVDDATPKGSSSSPPPIARAAETWESASECSSQSSSKGKGAKKKSAAKKAGTNKTWGRAQQLTLDDIDAQGVTRAVPKPGKPAPRPSTISLDMDDD